MRNLQMELMEFVYGVSSMEIGGDKKSKTRLQPGFKYFHSLLELTIKITKN